MRFPFSKSLLIVGIVVFSSFFETAFPKSKKSGQLITNMMAEKLELAKNGEIFSLLELSACPKISIDANELAQNIELWKTQQLISRDTWIEFSLECLISHEGRLSVESVEEVDSFNTARKLLSDYFIKNAVVL